MRASVTLATTSASVSSARPSTAVLVDRRARRLSLPAMSLSSCLVCALTVFAGLAGLSGAATAVAASADGATSAAVARAVAVIRRVVFI